MTPSRLLPPLRSACAALSAALALVAAPAAAQTGEAPPAGAPVAATVTPPAEKKPAAPPYSVPWALRPAAKVKVLRTDTTLALTEGANGQMGSTVATFLLGGYAIGNFVPVARLGFVGNSPPGVEGGAALTNPMIGAWYLFEPGGNFRITPFLGLAFPLGMGGGNTPEVATAAAARSGILTRSAMDNAMFAVNDLTVFPGLGAAWVAHCLTVQAEVTVLQLTRVRGELVQPDSSKTNFTSGLHVGYTLHKYLTLSSELRYQRWLSTPAAVVAAPKSRDNLTLAAGLRTAVKVGDITLRPGFSYSRPLDNPMSAQGYQMFQFDMPVLF